MGEAKRKRLRAESFAHEWVPLFAPDSPARVAISRPSSRAYSLQPYLSEYANHIARLEASGKPALCFNPDCTTELRALPETLVLLKTTDDPSIPPIGMGVCEHCVSKSDDEVRMIMRKSLERFGLDTKHVGHVGVVLDISIANWINISPTLRIAVVGQPGEPQCDAATGFAALLLAGMLPRFVAFRHGVHNCHAIIRQLYLDLLDCKGTYLFSFKRGSSAALKSEADPNGVHSWVEADGWAIDGSGGALGNPIVVQRIEDYYMARQLTNITDITAEMRMAVD